MTPMKAHTLRVDPDDGSDLLASIAPASRAGVDRVLGSDHTDRSIWVWVRFANGDLCLATFPQGDTYEAIEATVARDFEVGRGDMLRDELRHRLEFMRTSISAAATPEETAEKFRSAAKAALIALEAL